MKIIDWNTHTATPEGQMWLGVIGSLMSLLAGILDVAEPMSNLDRMGAFFAFGSVPFLEWTAWRGHKRMGKQVNPPAKSETFAAKPHLTGE